MKTGYFTKTRCFAIPFALFLLGAPQAQAQANDGGPPPVACGKLTATGCCFPDGNLAICSGGTIKLVPCQANPTCGWSSATSTYACGTSGGSSPSSAQPKACSNYLPPPPDGGPPINDIGQPPVLDKGGSPNPDKGAPPINDKGLPPVLDKGATPTNDGPPPVGCGKLTATGCCFPDGNLAICSGGTIKLVPCQANPTCGWSSATSTYACGTSGGSSPSSAQPKACSNYLPPPPDGGPPINDIGQPPVLDKGGSPNLDKGTPPINDKGTPPGKDSTTPGKDSTTPGTDSTTPGTDSTTPGTDSTTPGADSTTPGADSTTPGKDMKSATPDAAACACEDTNGCSLGAGRSAAGIPWAAMLILMLLLRRRGRTLN